MRAIFETRAGSGYDDDVARRYHFPLRYLPEAQRASEEWIIYPEPRRGGGREGYVAVARLDRIDAELAADPDRKVTAPGILFAICEELGLEIDFAKLPDECIGMVPDDNETPNSRATCPR